jgi:cell division protein ZapA
MPQFEVRINSRAYMIACEEGQDEHLTRLAEFVDKRVAELVSAVGQAGEARLLVMASLLIADELAETYAKLNDGDNMRSGQLEAEFIKTTEQIAERLERIADKLEAA